MKAMRAARVSLALTVTTLVAGCGGATTDGDQVACETFGNAHNVLKSAADEYATSTDEDDLDLATRHREALPGKIEDALVVVEDASLKIALSDARDIAPGSPGAGNQEMLDAYFLTAEQIFEKCGDLGTGVAEVD